MPSRRTTTSPTGSIKSNVMIMSTVVIIVGFLLVGLGAGRQYFVGVPLLQSGVVNPQISIDQTAVARGGIATLTGSGFTLNGNVNVWMQQNGGPWNVIAGPIADKSGGWAITVPFPTLGMNLLYAQDVATGSNTGNVAVSVVTQVTITTQAATSSNPTDIPCSNLIGSICTLTVNGATTTVTYCQIGVPCTQIASISSSFTTAIISVTTSSATTSTSIAPTGVALITSNAQAVVTYTVTQNQIPILSSWSPNWYLIGIGVLVSFGGAIGLGLGARLH